MAYVSDDPRPVRKPSHVRLDSLRQGTAAPVVRVAVAEVPSTRKGDDDPRPPRPSDEDMKRVLEERERDQREIAVAEAALNAEQRNDDQDGGEPAEVGAKGRTVKKLVVYSCTLLVGLWLCNVFYSVVRNVLIAQSRAELVLAALLLAATVAVFAFIVIYAWRLFAGLPRIDSVAKANYRGNPFKLMEKIQGEYLAHLPDSERFAKRLRKSRVRDDLALLLAKLRTHRYADSRSFLCDFRTFQELQDRQAAETIRRYALLIAVKTAVSPWRLVDMAAVFYNSTLMVCEIAGIYNRRISRAHAFRLLIGWVLNLYVSGELGQVMEGSADVLNDSLGDLLGDGLGSSIQPFLPLFAKFVGKAAEGGVNAYLAYRLGRRAVVAFRYLKK